MARLADMDDVSLIDVYAELRRREEEKNARHRGHRVPTGEGAATVDGPGPRLRALRAGRPVEINDWELPRWVRSGRVENGCVTVQPDDRIVDVDGVTAVELHGAVVGGSRG